MQHRDKIVYMVVAALLLSSCSSLFHSRSKDDAPMIHVTDIDSSRDYIPHTDVEEKKVEVIDTVSTSNQTTQQAKIDSLSQRDSVIVKPQAPAIHFTAEQSSAMVISEYVNAEFDDMTIKLGDYKSHYPTDGRHVTSPYGWRRGRMHAGIDLKVDKGDNIYAAFDGVVRLAKYYGAYGYCIILRHESGIETLYGHSSKLLVAVNDVVKAGDVIALGGSTGRSTGAHCHFETRVKGVYFDPNLVISTKSTQVKDGNLYLAKRGNRLFASNNDDTQAREAYILEQTTIKYYTVRSGDVLSRIAANNRTTVTKLCQLNHISSRSTLRIGQRLIVREGIKTPIKNKTNTENTASQAPAKQTTPTTQPKPTQAQSTSSTTVHTVRSGDTLSAIAQRYGTSVAKLCSINGISKTSTLSLGQKIKVSGSVSAPVKSTPAPSQSSSSSATVHTVKSGDTLSAIAAKYHTTVSAICSINGISANSTLSLGQKIKLSGSASKPATQSTSSAGYHIVRSGDTLSGIASKHNTTVAELCRLNNITKHTILQLEQKIKLP